MSNEQCEHEETCHQDACHHRPAASCRLSAVGSRLSAPGMPINANAFGTVPLERFPCCERRISPMDCHLSPHGVTAAVRAAHGLDGDVQPAPARPRTWTAPVPAPDLEE
jgi:hypothetical protein